MRYRALFRILFLLTAISYFLVNYLLPVYGVELGSSMAIMVIEGIILLALIYVKFRLDLPFLTSNGFCAFVCFGLLELAVTIGVIILAFVLPLLSSVIWLVVNLAILLLGLVYFLPIKTITPQRAEIVLFLPEKFCPRLHPHLS